MKRRNHLGVWGLAGTCAWALIACSGHESTSESLGSTEQAVRGKGVTLPVPKDSPTAWRASELLFADALATCASKTGDPDRERGRGLRDSSLDALRAKMQATMAAQKAPTPATWRAMRADKNRNSSEFSAADIAQTLGSQYPEAYDVDASALLNPAAAELQPVFDGVGVNLCIARGIYEQTRFESTLLTSSPERLAMLEIARERAQLAMLSITSLITAINAKTDGIPDDSIERPVWLLRRWAATAQTLAEGTPERVRLLALASDLKEAARLHVHLTTEIAQALHRHASARLPLPGAAPGSADALPADDFASKGWRERIVALLYGGDVLAPSTIGALPPLTDAPTDGRLAWPTRDERPSASAGKWTGEVTRLFALARAFGGLELDLKGATYNGPNDLAIDGRALYRRLEATLRTSLCLSYDAATNKCAAIDPSSLPDPTTANAEYELYKRHGLSLAHANALVGALGDVLPATGGAGLHLAGGFRVVASATGARLVIDGDTTFLPRSLMEAAGIYGRMGRAHLREVLAVASPSPVYANAALLSGADGARAEGVRSMGAIAALAAVQDLVKASTGTPAGGVLLGALKDPDASLANFLDGILGPTSASIRPVEGSFPTPAGVVLGHQRAPNGEPLWRVRATGAPSDPFWSGRIDELTFVATDQAASAVERLLDPSHDKPEAFAPIPTLIANAQAAGRSAAASRNASGALEANLPLPTDKAMVVIAVRRPRGKAADYRMIAGPVRLWGGHTQSGAVDVPIAVDSFFTARGGELERLASDALTPTLWDPARPELDGFGRHVGVIPDRSVQLNQDAPQLLDYVAQKLGLASTKAADAEKDLKTAFDLLETEENGTLEVSLAKGRALQDERVAIVTLCGTPPETTPAESDSIERRISRACGMSKIAIDAMGTQPLPAGTCQTPPPLRAAPVLASTVGCNEKGTPSEQLRCGFDRLMTSTNFALDVLQPVACAGDGGAVSLPPNLGGTLAELAVKQAGALQAYRARITELALAADAVLAKLATAEADVKVAYASEDTVTARSDAAARTNQQRLIEATQRYQLAMTKQKGANDYAQKLGITTPEEAVAAGGRALMAGAGGAAATVSTAAALAAPIAVAAAVPGIGWIAAGVGGLFALFSALGGPSDEEISKANTDIKVADKEVEMAATALADAANEAACAPNKPAPTTPDGGVAKCLPGSDTAIFQKETLEAEARTVLAHSQSTQAFRESLLQIQDRFAALQTAATDLVATRVSIDNTLRQATLAIEQARFEASQTKVRADGLFAIAQAFHGTSLRSALAKTDVSTGASLDAMRAMEFVYGRVLPQETTSREKAFAAPAKWAGDIFTDDLSPLRYVGTTSFEGLTGVMQERPTSFVSNLDNVSNGLFTALNVEAKRDGGLIINIPGPGHSPGKHDGARFAPQWRFYCPKTSTCAPQGGWCNALRVKDSRDGSEDDDTQLEAEDACVTSAGVRLLPERARVNLSIDVRGGLRNDPAASSNSVEFGIGARWIRFLANVALGLPGTVGESVTFSLRAPGPFIVKDERGVERVLPIAAYDTGLMGAKMTGDTYTMNGDEIRKSPDRVHTDFFGYPLAGTYELTLYAKATDDPQVVEPPKDLTRLRRFQLMFDRFYLKAK